MCVCVYFHIYIYVYRNIHINLRAECFPEKALIIQRTWELNDLIRQQPSEQAVGRINQGVGCGVCVSGRPLPGGWRQQPPAPTLTFLPETLSHKAQTLNPEPQTPNSKPETRNPKPGTLEIQPLHPETGARTRNPESGTRHPKLFNPGTRSLDLGTWIPEQGTTNAEHGPRIRTRDRVDVDQGLCCSSQSSLVLKVGTERQVMTTG